MDTSLHSASTASEISERLQDEADGSSTKYEEGQFESDEGRESAEESASAPSRGGSSSGEYASDTFEDDQEAVDTVAALDTAAASDAEGENDYGSDSFEQEDDQQVARTRQSTLHTDICDSQRPDELDNVHGKIQSAQGDRAICHTSFLNSQLGGWCSDKITTLKRTKVASRSPVQTSRTNLPATAVKQLIRQVVSSPNRRSPQPKRNTRQRCREKIRIPDPLVQHAQTQFWLTKLPSDDVNCSTVLPENATPSVRTEISTFCSMKKEKLLGELASRQVPQTIDRWMASTSSGTNVATLEFMQKMTAKQREFNAAAVTSDGSGVSVIHRLALVVRLQLEESIALRHHAADILDQAEYSYAIAMHRM